MVDCSSIYEPEPDVAGQAVFIAFLAHTGMFIFLALVITPIVKIYLPPVPNREYEIGEFELLRPDEDLGDIELDSGTASRPTTTILDGRRRIVYRCYCQEAIESTYTSQYIAGVAFAVTALVKHKSISYYHLRIIYCLLTMNTTIGIVTNFLRSSKLKYLASPDRKSGSRRKMIDVVLPCNIFVLVGFSIYLFLKDENFSGCYKYKLGPAIGSLVWFILLAYMSYIFRSAVAHVWFSILVSAFVAFQSWQIQDLGRTFRTKAPDPEQPDERSFTFGQILVLFMIVPLIGDFSAGLIADLRKIERNNWRNGLRSFKNLFLVLIPYFLRKVWDDTCAAIKWTFLFLHLQRPFSAVRTLIKGLFNRLVRAHQNRGERRDFRSTLPNRPTSDNAPSSYTPAALNNMSISHDISVPPKVYPQKRPSFPHSIA